MRYKILQALFILFLFGCEKDTEVTSVDQIPGLWRWESTCGGEEYVCVIASKTNYATIEFRDDGVYTEKRMDTLYIQTHYEIQKIDDTMGTLVLENPSENRPVTILNNALIVQRGSFTDSYTKIK